MKLTSKMDTNRYTSLQSQYINRIQSLISSGDLQTSVNELIRLTEKSKYAMYALNISFAYNALKKKIFRNILTNEEIRIEESKICDHVLTLLEEINLFLESESQKKSKVQIIIEGNLNDFDEVQQKKIKTILATMLDISFEEIKILNMQQGSIILTV